MADAPPPGERPPQTLKYFWERITFLIGTPRTTLLWELRDKVAAI